MRRTLPRALTVAGTDPCCGAGIAADMKTFTALGVRGFAVVTCLTAQNESEFAAAQKVSPDFIDAQFVSIARSGQIEAAKTGMLFDEETVISVCRNIRDFSIKNVVADPVIKSSSGERLLSQSGVEALKKELLPLCDFVTPNTFEARELCGVEIENTEDMKVAAREIAGLGVRKVVITGGHLPQAGDVTDLLFDGKNFFEIKRERVRESVHGSGCVFSSALCALKAKGLTDTEAARKAGHFTADMMIKSLEGREERP